MVSSLRQPLRWLPLPLLLAAALLASACSERHHSPTEPSATDLKSAAAGSEDPGDDKRGGKPPGGGGRPPQGGGDLTFELQPDVWNTNWEHSRGTVSALFRGTGVDKVDLSSIRLIGTKSGAAPLAPARTQRTGNQVRAFFAQSDAIALLDTPARGEVHAIEAQLTVDGQAKSLTTSIRVVGPDGGGGGGDDPLALEIQPASWNTNWPRSSGTVTALIRGDHLNEVDLDSIELVGTDPAAAPLPALRASLNGNHIRAFFDKGDAFETLDTPRPGEVHKIVIRLEKKSGDRVELTDRIRVVGPGRDGEDGL